MYLYFILVFKMNKYLQLIRVHQWYKNLVVFLALFFSENLLMGSLVGQTVLAFISISLISSSGYIFNDLLDMKKDALHPDKKHRPLAAGKISKIAAVIVALILFLIGIILAISLGGYFTLAAIILIALSSLYTFVLKKILLADVLTIALLFVIRAIAGALAIDVVISPWLILVPFFLSLFLSIGKRHVDLLLLKDKAKQTREVLEHYTLEFTNSMMTISTTLLIISYALYSSLSPHKNLIYSTPFALFTILRFYYLISSGSEIARKPERVIKDWPMIIGIVLWLISAVILIYG